jgi:hypothetical protein
MLSDLCAGLFGGWEVGGVTRYQTGPLLTPTGSASIPGDASVSILGRSGSAAVRSAGPNHWFKTAAFANPPATALGNAAVGIIEGPGWANWDASLRKVFLLHEEWSPRFQADLFDLANHPNFVATGAEYSVWD